MGYSTGEVAFERIFSSAVIMAGIVGGVFLVWGGIERYRKIWDDIYKMVLIASFSFHCGIRKLDTGIFAI